MALGSGRRRAHTFQMQVTGLDDVCFGSTLQRLHGGQAALRQDLANDARGMHACQLLFQATLVDEEFIVP